MQTKHSASDQSNNTPNVQSDIAPSQDERRRMVAEAAYFRAEHDAFQGGDADNDWYRAEAEIDALYTKKIQSS